MTNRDQTFTSPWMDQIIHGTSAMPASSGEANNMRGINATYGSREAVVYSVDKQPNGSPKVK